MPAERLNNWYLKYDPLTLISQPENNYLKFCKKWLLDIGDQDSTLLAGNVEFYQRLTAAGPLDNAVLMINKGKHDWNFWRERIIADLQELMGSL